ncbi:MAG: glycosyltransferase, partial [Thermoguttaceae bacterium]|nr:glycosyltransferase [Thermoguttaceae bacterium]
MHVCHYPQRSLGKRAPPSRHSCAFDWQTMAGRSAGLWRLRRLIAKLRPDLVHTWLFAANAYGRWAAVSCRVPVVVASERCEDPWKGVLEWLIDRWLARKTARIVVNSQAVRNFYLRYGLPRD